MVWCIANDLDFEGAKVKLPERFPFLEHTMLFNYEKVLPMLPDFSKEIPRFVKDAVGYINDLPSPRFIKSHLPFHLLPLQLQRGLTGAKLLHSHCSLIFVRHDQPSTSSFINLSPESPDSSLQIMFKYTLLEDNVYHLTATHLSAVEIGRVNTGVAVKGLTIRRGLLLLYAYTTKSFRVNVSYLAAAHLSLQNTDKICSLDYDKEEQMQCNPSVATFRASFYFEYINKLLWKEPLTCHVTLVMRIYKRAIIQAEQCQAMKASNKTRNGHICKEGVAFLLLALNLELVEMALSLANVNSTGDENIYRSATPSEEFLRLELSDSDVVYIARGVKDTCLSYFHHCQLLEGFKGSFHEFATLFINDSLCFAPFWDHVLGYWKRRDDPNMLFLKFEELKKDLPSVIKRTAEFLGKEMSTKEINILCDHLSFEKMKTNRAVNYEEVIEINKKYKFVEAEGSFMRSGQVGEAGKKFSPDWVQRFDQWTEDKLKDTGLNF
ncbi:hypothetical protein J6590_070654 [Homalodisca vitripennis]|nr:hypothetical protein J6590_070654 [Homalodisca vitripennis]